MANSTLTVDDAAKIQKVVRWSGLSRDQFMQLISTPCFQEGLKGKAMVGGTMVQHLPELDLETLPKLPERAYGIHSEIAISYNDRGVPNWSYQPKKIKLIGEDEPVPEGWQLGNYALAEGMRHFGLFPTDWAWAARSVPQALVFPKTRFLLRSNMHVEHVRCYAFFEIDTGTWKVEAGYHNRKQYVEKNVIYHL